MCQLNARCLSDDKKAVVFVLTDLWTSGEREASNNNEEWGATWWGGSAAVGPWVGTYSQGVRTSTGEGEREWERPLQRDQRIPGWEGPKRKVEAGHGQVWMPSGAGATEGALVSVQWGPVWRRIYRPEIDTVSVSWLEQLLWWWYCPLTWGILGWGHLSELSFEYVQVEILGDKMRKSREQVDKWIKLYLITLSSRNTVVQP